VVAESPDGLSFAIRPLVADDGEAALAVVQETASWLSVAGRPCVPVVAATADVGEDSLDGGVLVTCIDRLAGALNEAGRGFEEVLEADALTAPSAAPGVSGPTYSPEYGRAQRGGIWLRQSSNAGIPGREER
jgi:hypothetical protein